MTVCVTWGGGAQFLHFFQAHFFRQNKFETDRETRKAVWGVRGHATPKNFWKFTCCNGYFCAFWIIFSKILFKFFDPSSEGFAKYDTFCSHIFAYACLRRTAYCYRRDSKLWKNCIHQKHFLKWLVGGCIPLILLPASAPGHKLKKPSKESGIF